MGILSTHSVRHALTVVALIKCPLLGGRNDTEGRLAFRLLLMQCIVGSSVVFVKPKLYFILLPLRDLLASCKWAGCAFLKPAFCVVFVAIIWCDFGLLVHYELTAFPAHWWICLPLL